MIVIAIITHKIEPFTFKRSKPMIAAKPSNDIMTGNEVKSPILTGIAKPLLITNFTLVAAINNKNSPIPIPAPCAMLDGRLRKIQERIPVTEIKVKSTPIKKIAPSATGISIF